MKFDTMIIQEKDNMYTTNKVQMFHGEINFVSKSVLCLTHRTETGKRVPLELCSTTF